MRRRPSDPASARLQLFTLVKDEGHPCGNQIHPGDDICPSQDKQTETNNNNYYIYKGYL